MRRCAALSRRPPCGPQAPSHPGHSRLLCAPPQPRHQPCPAHHTVPKHASRKAWHSVSNVKCMHAYESQAVRNPVSLNTCAQNLMNDSIDTTTSLDEVSWTIPASVRPVRSRTSTFTRRVLPTDSHHVIHSHPSPGSANATKHHRGVPRQSPRWRLGLASRCAMVPRCNVCL